MSVKTQIDELTGLRGVAALFILLNHILLVYPVLRNNVISSSLSCLGYMGMDLFFILSGFVICYNYADRIKNNPQNGIREFLVARFARLYPLYILFIVFFFLFYFLKYHNNTELIAQNITSLPIFISGMQSWFYGFIGDTPIIHMQGSANISWSISTEFALYLFFIPLVWLLLKLNSKKAYIISIVSLIIIQILWIEFSHHNNFIVSFLNKTFGEHSNYAASTWLNFHSPISRLWQFLCGCVIARSYNPEMPGKNLRLYKTLGWLSGLALAGLVIAAPRINISYLQYFTMPLWVLFILFTVHSENKILKSKLFIFLGNVSYSTYLLHIILVLYLSYDGNHLISYIINLPLFFVLTYLMAYIVYKYYEMPMRKKVKDFLLNR